MKFVIDFQRPIGPNEAPTATEEWPIHFSIEKRPGKDGDGNLYVCLWQDHGGGESLHIASTLIKAADLLKAVRTLA